MKGLVNINKPQNMTSHDVIYALRRILNEKKMGHSGTLDPMATGVLNVFIGKATKLIPFVNNEYKIYKASMILGFKSDTLDIWGTVKETKTSVEYTEEQIKNVFDKFTGEIDQVPPMYSARKVNGKKLYELAREGIEIERKSRKVTIKNIKLIDIVENSIIFEVVCSKGTYIRTLIDDIGKELGTFAIMNNLVRLENEGFTIEESYSLEQVADMVKKDDYSFLISMRDIINDLPEVFIENEKEYEKFSNGVNIYFKNNLKYFKIIYDDELVGIAKQNDIEVKILKRF